MTLCYSRALYVEFFFDQSLANFLSGHIHAFEHFAGVTRRVATDNLPFGNARAARRAGPLPSPLPRELAGYYCFEVGLAGSLSRAPPNPRPRPHRPPAVAGRSRVVGGRP